MTIKERIGWMLLSWRKSEAANSRVSLPRVTENARKVCVVLPANFDDFDIVRTILPDILARLMHAQTTIFVRENFRSWLVINEFCVVKSFDPVHATRFGMPDEQTLKSVKSAEFDLLIDLSVSPELYVAGLVKEARAQTKIALAHPATSNLYNLLVESTSNDNGRRIMALLNYL
ncbi:MAG: hypothetical protein KDB65_11745 [Calditrichaeota bacterium]|nr:hypothetical protein [Calditrichota bacterium]MCB9368654.1 hypothetical protein [Calditrichota bacterium]